MNISHVLFDLDGTLFNFEKCEHLALDSAFMVYGIELSDDKFAAYKEINSKLWEEFEKGLIERNDVLSKRFEIFLDSINMDIPPEQLNEMYLYFLSGNFFLEYGALDVLLKLHDKYHLYIVTNGVESVQLKKMAGANLFPFFDNIFISETIGYPKPEYSFFKYCLNKMNCLPEECLIVGDSLLSDICGGINAGMHTCWYNPFKKKNCSQITPDYEIEQLTDISIVISKINSN